MRTHFYATASAATAILFWAVAAESAQPVRPVVPAASPSADFAHQVDLGDQVLTLHGVGTVKYLKLIDVYVGALYLPADVATDRALDDVPKRLELVYQRRVRRWQIRMASDVALKRNLSGEELSKLAPRLAAISDAYAEVGEGDRYTLTYVPGEGTELALNGESLGLITGSDFASAYYQIWFGERPLSKRFKREVLAGSSLTQPEQQSQNHEGYDESLGRGRFGVEEAIHDAHHVTSLGHHSR